MTRRRLMKAMFMTGMALTAIVAVTLWAEVQAADFPTRPIDYIVPFSPGGG